MKKIILAYSGGLDTSCCIKWLRDRGYEVICFVADLGQGEDFNLIKNRALKIGASKVYCKNLQDEFIKDFILPALRANAVYEGKYLLATALGRPLIAKHLVNIAHKENTKYIAHGCTGKGNDQVRFEISAKILDPKLKTIAPVRIWHLKSRNQEIDYALKNKIPVEVTRKKPYSIDRNIWGLSIECGILENEWQEPTRDTYISIKAPERTPNKAKYIVISSQQGIPNNINGKTYNLRTMINILNKIGADYGIGRSDLIEDRVVGIKSREIYEAPAATILLKAHKELENLVLDRKTIIYKELISLKYAEIVYSGLWFSKFKNDLDKYINKTQNKVTGEVKLKLYKGNCEVVGRKSKFSLYKRDISTYSKNFKFNQKSIERFVKFWNLPTKI